MFAKKTSLFAFGVCAATLARTITASEGKILEVNATAVGLERAATLEPSETLRLSGLELETEAFAAALLLRPFEVFAPDAIIVVHGDEGDRQHPVPHNIYLGGSIEGRNGSFAALTIRQNGQIRGLVADAGRRWSVITDSETGELQGEAIPSDPQTGFECEADLLQPDEIDPSEAAPIGFLAQLSSLRFRRRQPHTR